MIFENPPDGYHKAVAFSAGLDSFSDGITYVWIRFRLIEKPFEDRSFLWKRGISKGSAIHIERTFKACGVLEINSDPDKLRGLSDNIVEINLITAECMDEPGHPRTFVREVRFCETYSKNPNMIEECPKPESCSSASR